MLEGWLHYVTYSRVPPSRRAAVRVLPAARSQQAVGCVAGGEAWARGAGVEEVQVLTEAGGVEGEECKVVGFLTGW